MLEKTIQLAATMQADDFQSLFARISGWVGSQANCSPEATCMMEEVGELFDVLFDRMQGIKVTRIFTDREGGDEIGQNTHASANK